MKRGFALHEMIVSLTVMSGILVIAAHFSTRQLGFLRDMGNAATGRGQLAETVAIAAAMLANIQPGAGDLLLAQDSVLEFRLATAIGVVCAGAPGRVVIPLASQENDALAALLDAPRAGDRMDALLSDSAGTTWLSFHVLSADASMAGCPAFPGVSGTLGIALAEPFALPEGAPLRFSRPFRLSHYRSSDGKWYLGGRDWNAADNRFNTIQPLAGPLLGRDADYAGLTFRYADVHGTTLQPPVDVRQVALISIVARAAAPAAPLRDRADSAVAMVAVRR